MKLITWGGIRSVTKRDLHVGSSSIHIKITGDTITVSPLMLEYCIKGQIGMVLFSKDNIEYHISHDVLLKIDESIDSQHE